MAKYYVILGQVSYNTFLRVLHVIRLGIMGHLLVYGSFTSFDIFYDAACVNECLLSCDHVLEVDFVFCKFALANDGNVRYLLGIGIAHLLLHLGRVGIYFSPDACSAHFCEDVKAEVSLFLSKVHEEHLSGIDSLLGIEVKLVEHIEDAVSTKRDSHTAEAWHAKDACEVIVTSTACDGTYLHIESLHLEDGACVIVEAAGKCEVKLYFVFQF